ncbi:Kelch-type beta propeller [Arabidopsis thaliana x Arabidopsis arenosa]|uniref:Kelch-type beta propeller n=1 Tax=Arabidopsis thaliana x Arabidopsis arenosa TaxID=1240361 RepID=A0A8T2A9E0_9BRAS|nr:Kelch-type beta propeller [Arabidopsis thaliana x Arabidopsis arenosa]
MLKRPRSSLVLKRHGSSLVVLPHDVVELILERLAVKSLLRFKSVSKKWESTIESQRFKERQLIRSRGPDVIFFTWNDIKDEARIVSLGSSIIRLVKFPVSNTRICHGSCDGLICLFSNHSASFVVNPATGWHQSFPLSNVQKLLSNMYKGREKHAPCLQLGFGKDKFKGTYKPVLLCNSSEYGLANATTCQVFDFTTNSWRYVLPASPYRIFHWNQKPVYFDGSLYWLTEGEEETKVISFDLHTETFQVICKAPFPYAPYRFGVLSVILCILDNRLCVTQQNWPTQMIWSLGSNKTWKILCSIDLTSDFYFPFSSEFEIILPLAILEKKKLLLGRDGMQPLVIHDLHTKSNDTVFIPRHNGYPVSYFQSLFSVSSN